jgi:hypothetical protein
LLYFVSRFGCLTSSSPTVTRKLSVSLCVFRARRFSRVLTDLARRMYKVSEGHVARHLLVLSRKSSDVVLQMRVSKFDGISEYVACTPMSVVPISFAVLTDRVPCFSA